MMALMIPRQASAQIHEDIPALWRTWIEHGYGCSPRFTRELWRVFCRLGTPAQLYLLRHAEQYGGEGRVEALLAAIRPEDMMTISEALAPRVGPRPRELVQFQERIVQGTTKAGAWR